MTGNNLDFSSRQIIDPSKQQISQSNLPYKVLQNETLGRYCVAARDLEAQEIIFQEEPFVSAPSDEPGIVPMCLGCCKRMNQDPDSRCPNCHWPVCSTQCSLVSFPNYRITDNKRVF